jgi:hypothetical protein
VAANYPDSLGVNIVQRAGKTGLICVRMPQDAPVRAYGAWGGRGGRALPGWHWRAANPDGSGTGVGRFVGLGLVVGIDRSNRLLLSSETMTERERMQVAIEAHVSLKTVRKWDTGAPVQPVIDKAIRDAIARLEASKSESASNG